MPDSQHFFADPAVDTLAEIVFRLGSEVFVLSSQLRHVQRVLEERGVVTRAEWDSYQPDAEMQAWLATERQSFASRLLEPLTGPERSHVAPEVVAPWNPADFT
jgi:poly(3-hydroxyalkanoate) synthetase